KQPLTYPSVPWCVPRSPFHQLSCNPGGRHLQCGHPAVTACGFTAEYPLRACASSAALHEWSCSLLGPVTCPKRLQGGREGGRTPSAFDHQRNGTFGEWVPEFDRYPLPLLVQSPTVIGSGSCPP
ncbi:unnamed protein product, partial [Staurois parvus]